jgi:hypothetical protein
MPQVHSSMHVIRKLKLSENLRFRMMFWGYGSTVGALPKMLNEAEQRIKQAEGCGLRSRKEYLGLLEELYYLLEISRSYSSFAKRIRNKAKEARQYIGD